MRFVNRLTAILYSVVFGFLLLASFGSLAQAPYEPFLIVLMGVPVVVNWLCYFNWGKADSIIRPVSLIVALLYATFLLAIVATALVRREYDVFLGLFIFGPPVIVSYFSFHYWPAGHSV